MSRMCKPVASCPYFSELAVGFQPFVLPWDARCLHKAAQKTISRNGDVTQYFFGKGDYVIAVYLFHGVTHRIDYIKWAHGIPSDKLSEVSKMTDDEINSLLEIEGGGFSVVEEHSITKKWYRGPFGHPTAAARYEFNTDRLLFGSSPYYHLVFTTSELAEVFRQERWQTLQDGPQKGL
jgi:hypothetical protein